jgi:glycosyltransferase 2 family protein
MNQRLTLYLSITLGFLLVGIWFYIIDFGEMLSVFQTVKISLIFPLILLFTISYFLRSLRWKVFLSPIENITAIESFNLCMINYFINFLIPVHAGELLKSLLLKRMKGTPVSKSLPSVYIDKITDLLPIFLLLIMAPFIKGELSSISYLASAIILFLLLLFAFSLIFVIYRKDFSITCLEKLFFFLPGTFKLRLRSFLDRFIEGLSSLSQLSNRLFEIIGLTFLALIFHCFFMWLFFFSFGIELPILTLLVGYSLLHVAFILPAPPGFSGTLELTFVFIFTFLFGHDKNIVSAVASSSHVFIAILFGLFGISAIALIGTKVSTIFRIESEYKMGLEKLQNK